MMLLRVLTLACLTSHKTKPARDWYDTEVGQSTMRAAPVEMVPEPHEA